MQAAFELFTEKDMEHTSVSEISSRAGVAKGTFYLYFKDKSDINSRLIAHKSNIIFSGAFNAMNAAEDCTGFEDKMIFIVNYIIDVLSADHRLMKFINKNLSWVMFRDAVIDNSENEPGDCLGEFRRMTENSVENPDIMLFLILEMLSGSCYGPIIDSSPAPMEEIKPYVFKAVKGIISEFAVKE